MWASAGRRWDNIRSLELGLAVDTLNGSVDYWPTNSTKITGRGNLANYSDGNQRWFAQAEIRQRVFFGPDVWVGAKLTKYEFTEQFDNGYFNPESLTSAEGLLEINGKLSESTYFSVRGSAGYEDALPGEGKFIWAGGITVSHEFNDTLTLLATAEHFSSTLGSTSGFERTTIGVGVNVQW